MLSSGVRGGVSSSFRPEVSVALNEKLGSVEVALRCAVAESERGMSMCIEAEAGRLLGLLVVCCRSELVCGGRIGKLKSGFGTIVIMGPPADEVMLPICPAWKPGATTSVVPHKKSYIKSRLCKTKVYCSEPDSRCLLGFKSARVLALNEYADDRRSLNYE